jgi:hypothetical protein
MTMSTVFRVRGVRFFAAPDGTAMVCGPMTLGCRQQRRRGPMRAVARLGCRLGEQIHVDGVTTGEALAQRAPQDDALEQRTAARRASHGSFVASAEAMPRARVILVALLLVVAGCAMRVSGTVRDRATGYPVGGAVITADDGRGRLAFSDGNGNYALKTDWRPATLAVTAAGFRSTTVEVRGHDQYPVVDVDLDRAERLPAPESARE